MVHKNNYFARVKIEDKLAYFEDMGIEQYKIESVGDAHVCAYCQAHNGRAYYIRDAVIGKNAPPFCKDCRCKIQPVYEVGLPWESDIE